jgi:O-acetyl-ADP-ribose deacetylase (regulator of RNase III)
MKVSVVMGDIAPVEADALITAVNHYGVWFENGMNGVLRRAGDSMFHDQLADALVEDPDLLVFATERGRSHLGAFDVVIFVIDNVGLDPSSNEMLNVIVRRGLVYASDHGYRRVSMPLMRFGSRRSVGGSVEEKLDDIALAIVNQMADLSNNIEELTVVVYDDTAFAGILREMLGLD